ncbi:hypothetical protein [Ewingella americana]|uniref:Uncharacterized protein n=1 Tax=Ewingella americana TaxID=41202 RepID=A0A502GDX2_9GAMM|nr:hypothetical protein [Ewingella americana]TPG60105.1 hypothetical protein EAH77_16180 [Ewingella americana]
MLKMSSLMNSPLRKNNNLSDVANTSAAISNLKALPAVLGKNGQAIFISETNTLGKIVSDSIFRKLRLISSDDELTLEKQTIKSFKEVFDTWTRSATVPAELSAWTYNANLDIIANTTNSSGFVGVASPDSYSNNVFEITLSSTNGDDDLIGIILAFARVGTKDYTLSAIRSVGGFGNGKTAGIWSIVYNLSQPDQKIIFKKSGELKWGNGGVGETGAESGYVEGTAGQGWNAFPNGVSIKSTRDGDSFKVITTQLNDPDNYVASSEISLDLNSDAVLAVFKGSASVGFMALSQAASSWKIKTFSGGPNTIIDSRNGGVLWSYDYASSSWKQDTSYPIENAISAGRLYSNETTKALFYSEPGDTINLTRLK